jgi:hypothetical protein
VLPAIPPTRDLACWADEQGVAIFYVTVRLLERYDDTLANLRHVGFPEPTDIFLRTFTEPCPPYQPSPDCSPIEFKSAARAHIRARGYQILSAIGDQHSDLRGDFVERTFKLPNPMYHTP